MTINNSVIAAISPLLLLTLGLGFTVVTDPYIKRQHWRVMPIIAALCLTLTAQSCFALSASGSMRGTIITADRLRPAVTEQTAQNTDAVTDKTKDTASDPGSQQGKSNTGLIIGIICGVAGIAVVVVITVTAAKKKK